MKRTVNETPDINIQHVMCCTLVSGVKCKTFLTLVQGRNVLHYMYVPFFLSLSSASSMSLPAIPQVTSVMSRPDLATASHGSTRSLSRGTEGENLVLRMQYLESLCGSLHREKKAMEDEFGRQRKKFMNNMIEKEAELNMARQREEKLSMEVRELSTQLLARDEELNNLKMTAKLSDSHLQERFDVERVKYEEEIASLRGMIEGK